MSNVDYLSFRIGGGRGVVGELASESKGGSGGGDLTTVEEG